MDLITNWLLRVLNIKAPPHTSIVDKTITWHGMLSWGWLLLIVLVLGVAVVWSYRRAASANISPLRRYTMAGLRIGFLFVLLLILMRPVLRLTLSGSVRRTLVVMVDGTLSMDTADPRSESPEDLARAAIAKGLIDPTKGLKQQLPSGAAGTLGKVTRLDLLQSVLTNPKLALLSRLSKEYDLRIYSFGFNPKTQHVTTEVTPAADKLASAASGGGSQADTKDGDQPKPLSLDWVKQIKATSTITPIGDAIREVTDDTRGLPRAGFFICTDGGNNSGIDPLNVAQNISAHEGESLPIYTYGIGMSSPKDVIVVDMVADPFCFIKEETGVTVRVRGQNLAGQSAQLQLFLVDSQNNAEQVDSKDITFGPDGDQVIAMKFTPKHAGDYVLRAYVPPLPNEASITNNVIEQHLRVLDKKINILMVERQPRWEYDNLMSQLLRDRRVDLKCVLFDGDPEITSAPNSPYLPRFPERKELMKFDAVILGDVDPKSLSAANMDDLLEFVSKFGGGFMMIAGKEFAPNAYRGTPIEKLVPVDLDLGDGGGAMGLGGSDDLASSGDGYKPIHLELTDKGLHSPMLELSDKASENAQIWQNLPPIYWDARVGKAKEGTDVLLQDPDDAKSTRFGRMPVLVMGHYGGNVIFVGTDNTWRWRKNRGEEYYIRFWNQMVLRVALPHLLGFSKRTQIKTDKESYVTGDRVTIDASIYDQNYQPVTDPQITGYYGNGGAGDTVTTNDREVLLKADPSQPGHYVGQFLAPSAGSYKIHLSSPGDPTVYHDFTTSTPTTEAGDTAMNETLLKNMSKASGGQFFREEDLYKLPQTIGASDEKVSSTQERDLRFTPLYFLLLLGLVSAEWIVRKTAQLK